jgi:hypothetical protein
MREFDRFSAAARPVLLARYGERAIEEMLPEIRAEYERLIPELPFIGGSRNRLTENLIGTTSSLALYIVLRGRGESPEQVGALHQEIVEAYLSALPKWRFRLMRGLLSTKVGLGLVRWSLKRAAAMSLERRYPEDFVFRYVAGRDGEFDFGLDYEACAIVNFFRRQGAQEFTRYVCLFDYPHSRLAGTGLVRTRTLAEGAETCDFRFRIGHQPENLQQTRVQY